MHQRQFSPLRSAFAFLFAPDQLVKMSVTIELQDHLAHPANADLRRYYDEGRYRPENDLATNARSRIAAMRRSLLRAVILVGASALIAVGTGLLVREVLGTPPRAIAGVLQFVGGVTLLFATVWQLDPSERSMSGDTVVERTHAAVFKLLSVVGTFVAALPSGW